MGQCCVEVSWYLEAADVVAEVAALWRAGRHKARDRVTVAQDLDFLTHCHGAQQLGQPGLRFMDAHQERSRRFSLP